MRRGRWIICFDAALSNRTENCKGPSGLSSKGKSAFEESAMETIWNFTPKNEQLLTLKYFNKFPLCLLARLLAFLEIISIKFTPCHCVKSFRMWRFSDPYLSAFRIWRRRNTPYLSVISSNGGKYGPEKLRIRILFTRCTEAYLTPCHSTMTEHLLQNLVNGKKPFNYFQTRGSS